MGRRTRGQRALYVASGFVCALFAACQDADDPDEPACLAHCESAGGAAGSATGGGASGGTRGTADGGSNTTGMAATVGGGTGAASAANGGGDGGASGADTRGGDCEPLPESFQVSGCGLNLACLIHQDGCDVDAYCGKQHLSFQGDDEQVALIHPQTVPCTIGSEGDTVVGQCETDVEGRYCSLSTRPLLPHPACVELPHILPSLSVCDAASTHLGASKLFDCRVAQNRCDVQLLCDDGAVYLRGEATQDGLRILGSEFVCDGSWLGDEIVGACDVPSEDALDACNFSVEAPQGVATACEEVAPTEGFALAGCTRDGNLCHMAQRGCLWNVTCGRESYAGRMTESNVFAFTSELGADCVANVVDGEFVGHCEWGTEFCDFYRGDLERDEGCAQLAPDFEIEVCGQTRECTATQNGCRWQASCDHGHTIYFGDVSEDSLTFEGTDGSICTADFDSGADAFLGECHSGRCGETAITLGNGLGMGGQGP